MWLFNGSPIQTIANQSSLINITEESVWSKVKLSSNSLQIPTASRSHSGRYRCLASNSLGEAASDEIHVQVRYPPVCGQALHVQHVASAQQNESQVITCDLIGDPLEMQVHWLWKPIVLPPNETVDYNALMQEIDSNASRWPFLENQSISSAGWKLVFSERVLSISSSNINNSSKKAIARSYFNFNVNAFRQTPLSLLQCWANNSVGHQLSPCTVHVLSARSPDPPFNCSVKNTTKNALAFVCSAGYSGGMQQHFHLEVYESIKKSANKVNSLVPFSTLALNSTLAANNNNNNNTIIINNNNYNYNSSSDSMKSIKSTTIPEDSKHSQKLLFNLTVSDDPIFVLNQLPEGTSCF